MLNALPRAMALCASVAVAILAGSASVGASPATAERGQPAAPAARSLADPAFDSRTGVPSVMLPALERLVRPSQHPVTPGARKFPHVKTLVYTAQYWGNDLKIYKVEASTPSFIESLTSGLRRPQGIATTVPSAGDREANHGVRGDWYVANTGDSNIPIYESTPSGPQGPTSILDDRGEYPADVAVSDTMDLVVASNMSTTRFGPGSLSLYANGATSPTGQLTVDGLVEGVGVAFDRAGDCFWSINQFSSATASIVEFPHCSGAATTVVSDIGFAGGIAFDRDDNLYYADQVSGVYKCVGTSQCTLLASGFSDPMFINFDAEWATLWLTDAGGYIDAIDPETGAIRTSTLADGGFSDPPFGIALAPGARY